MHPHASRLRLALAVAAIALAGAIAAVVVAAAPEEPRPTPATGFRGSLMPEGVRMPPISLRDQDGARFTSHDLGDRPAIVTFVYAECTESCGPQLQLVRGALDDLGHDIPVLAVSADPASDTPTRAKRFLLEQRMTGRARFLLGSPRELQPVYEGFFVQPQTEDQEHHARIVLVDGDGFQRVGYNIESSTSDDLLHDIRVLEREE